MLSVAFVLPDENDCRNSMIAGCSKIKHMKRFLLCFILLGFHIALFAQTNITVKGTVTTPSGEALAGVTVRIKGVGRVRLTSDNGGYEIQAPPKGVLVFSFVGYKTNHEKENGRTQINLSLEEENKNLNEVVVIGYGTTKRKDLTGAVSSVKGEELSKMPVQNVASALAGRVAGMQVTASDGTPGAEPSIIIRGGGSITQSNEPLYVIDGVAQTGGLGFLDPTDIESIEVLKDASATAIYGARGANGVVLVTTKVPKAGKLAVAYDMYYGAKKLNKILPMLNPYQYTLLEYERSLGDPAKEATFLANYGPYTELKQRYGYSEGINWQEKLFGNATNSQYHKISVGGGSKETRFNFFYSHNDDEGIMLNSGSKKDIAKLILNHNAGRKLKVGSIINYSNQNIFGVGTQEGNTKFNQLQNILQYRPLFGLKGSEQDFINMDEDPALAGNSGNVLQNPLTNAEAQQRNTNIQVLNLNASLDYELVKNLTYRGVAGYRTAFNKAKLFNDARSMDAKRTGGPNGSISQLQQSGWNYTNTLTYANTFNRVHKLDVLIGQEQIYAKRESFSVTSSRFPNVNLGLDDISQGTLPGTPASFTDDERMLSFFSRVNYSYKERYILTGSIRADGSSKFGPNNKFGYFPSAAFAWRIINEEFMQKVKALSDLKLRLSYGTTGNNRIDNYLSLSLFQSGNYPLNNNNVITVGAANLANPDLKWEKTRSFNAGLDVGFFNQRIQLTVDAYDNRTSDLLLNAAIPTSSGFKTMLINVGSTQNRGVEFTLNTVNIRKNGFEWTTNFNIGFNRNTILGLTNGVSTRYAQSWSNGISGGINALGESDYSIQVGSPAGQMYGYRFDGVYQLSDFDYNATTKTYKLKAGIAYDPNYIPQPGYVKYKDRNGDGSITGDDREVIGNANPKFTGGLNNTFSYKGFDLGIFINFCSGNNIYNANRLYGSMTQNTYPNAFSYIADRWSTIDATGQRVTDPDQLAQLNQGRNVPAYNGAGTALRLDDRFIEDGSFIRLSNISVGYTFPVRLLSKIKLSRARVYVTASNLYTFTNYSGYDPEVSVANATRLTPGVNFGGYPRTRAFVTGLNVSF